MPRYDSATRAEIYATEKADGWLYDERGYCPFTRVRLEGLIRNAYDAGAASSMNKGSLTAKQRDAVVDVLNERIAGGTDDLRDALGLTSREAGDMMRILERVRNKLLSKEDKES